MGARPTQTIRRPIEGSSYSPLPPTDRSDRLKRLAGVDPSPGRDPGVPVRVAYADGTTRPRQVVKSKSSKASYLSKSSKSSRPSRPIQVDQVVQVKPRQVVNGKDIPLWQVVQVKPMATYQGKDALSTCPSQGDTCQWQVVNGRASRASQCQLSTARQVNASCQCMASCPR